MLDKLADAYVQWTSVTPRWKVAATELGCAGLLFGLCVAWASVFDGLSQMM